MDGYVANELSIIQVYVYLRAVWEWAPAVHEL